MTKRNFKWSILFALLITLFIFIVACTQKEPISVDSPDYNQETFMNLAEMEQTLENFASVLPEALTDLELSKIVYDEAKRNEEDEPYALWSEIADISTQSGKTLRKEVQNVLEKRSLGKLASVRALQQLWMKWITYRYISIVLKNGMEDQLFQQHLLRSQ
ncbi:MAG: hypothetical protein KAX28_04260 [Candidatus Marinimicrobia bacterium]|nr:hypothetical protein [Candidatus Neomarinimicrobiota bacterium]